MLLDALRRPCNDVSVFVEDYIFNGGSHSSNQSLFDCLILTTYGFLSTRHFLAELQSARFI